MNPLLLKYERGFLYSFNVLFLSAGNMCFRIEVKHQSVAIILVSFPFFSTIRVVPDSGVSLYRLLVSLYRLLVSLYRLLVAFYRRFGTITIRNKGGTV